VQPGSARCRGDQTVISDPDPKVQSSPAGTGWPYVRFPAVENGGQLSSVPRCGTAANVGATISFQRALILCSISQNMNVIDLSIDLAVVSFNQAEEQG